MCEGQASKSEESLEFDQEFDAYFTNNELIKKSTTSQSNIKPSTLLSHTNTKNIVESIDPTFKKLSHDEENQDALLLNNRCMQNGQEGLLNALEAF